MKKSLTILTALLVLSVAVTFCAHFYVNGMKDDVTVKETITYGDKTAAKGITMSLKTNWHDKLCWDIDFTISEGTPKSKSSFCLNHDKHESSSLSFNNAYLSEGNGYSYIKDSRGITFTPQRLPQNKYFPDVIKHAKESKKKTYTERVKLSDYFNYLPLFFTVDFDSFYVDNNEKTDADATKYFKIPVYEELEKKVTLTKDSSGNIEDFEEKGNFTFDTFSSTNKNGCYLAISSITIYPKGDYDNPTYQPLPEHVRGIHYVPFISDVRNKDMLYADFSNARRICSLKANEKPTMIQESVDKKTLFLILETEERGYLSVIDKASGKEMQRIDIGKNWVGSGFGLLKEKDDLLFILFGDGEFRLLQKKDNLYTLEVDDCLDSARTSSGLAFDISHPKQTDFDYDGQKLAITNCNWGLYSHDSAEPQSNFTALLYVFDKDGTYNRPLYVGEYRPSTAHHDENSEIESYTEGTPVTVSLQK